MIIPIYHGKIWKSVGKDHPKYYGKYESQIGSSSQLLRKIKAMFETTNQG